LSNDSAIPEHLLRRTDETEDALFYTEPRLVTHIDDATIASLTDYYRETLPTGGDVLDLMSSWISHLPEDVQYGRVAGLGMNAHELECNPRLRDWRVHDLNQKPDLPYADQSFDAVVIAVSIQYLIRPVDVMASVRRVLRPGGSCTVAMSHRLFPTKAIAAFHGLPPVERVRLVSAYFERAGGFEPAEFIDRSPPAADPLWLVRAERAGFTAGP